MNIFLQDPNEIRLPPEQVRLKKVKVTPQPSGRQVKVHLELTPFQKRPNLEVTITSSSGKEVGHTSILEPMVNIMEFTLHLRQIEAEEELRMETTVYYQKFPEPSDSPVEMTLPDPMIVDQKTVSFKLQNAEI